MCGSGKGGSGSGAMRVEIRTLGRGQGRKDIHCIFLIRKVDVPKKMFGWRWLDVLMARER